MTTIADRLRAVSDSLLDIAEELDIEARVGGRKLEDFDWSVRVRNAFEKERIATLGQLVRYTPLRIKTIPNVGNLSLQEIETKLAEVGLRLKQH